MLNDSLYSSDRMDWETPKYLFDALDKEFGFTLDACASETNAKCAHFFDLAADSLSQQWSGTVWMNPPYGREIPGWVSKARSEVEIGNADIVVCLVPVRSDSRWWHEHCMKAAEIRLLDQRIEFCGSNNKAPFPTAIVIFRRNANDLRLSSYDVRSTRSAK